MDLRNPHTHELVQPAEHEPRGAPVRPADTPAALETPKPEEPTLVSAGRELGLSIEALAACVEHGVSPGFIHKLITERNAAAVALAGIDHVLAMLGIEAI